jgi:hypothetical protein
MCAAGRFGRQSERCETLEVRVSVFEWDRMMASASCNQEITGAATDASAACTVTEVAGELPDGVGDW